MDLRAGSIAVAAGRWCCYLSAPADACVCTGRKCRLCWAWFLSLRQRRRQSRVTLGALHRLLLLLRHLL